MSAPPSLPISSRRRRVDTIEKFANDLQGGLARVAGHPVSYRDTQFSRPAGSPLVTAIHHWAERELAAARTPDVRAFLSQFTEGAGSWRKARIHASWQTLRNSGALSGSMSGASRIPQSPGEATLTTGARRYRRPGQPRSMPRVFRFAPSTCPIPMNRQARRS